jgi:hypothetical protein
VTPSCGFVVLPHQWGTVLVVGRTDTPPPIVVDVGSNDDAVIGFGLTVGVPVTPVPAQAELVLSNPTAEPARNASNPTLLIPLPSW